MTMDDLKAEIERLYSGASNKIVELRGAVKAIEESQAVLAKHGINFGFIDAPAYVPEEFPKMILVSNGKTGKDEVLTQVIVASREEEDRLEGKVGGLSDEQKKEATVKPAVVLPLNPATQPMIQEVSNG